MIASAPGSLAGITERPTDDDSQLDEAARFAPSASDWRAMSRAERMAVPSVTREAVMLAAPESCAGSDAAPASKVRLAAVSGSSVLLATITRRPLGRVRSTGVGRTAAGCTPIGGGAWRWPSAARAATGPV
jgi:hypothetical protein